MENTDEVHIGGRVTRSLRKRLTSIDSDAPSSRPGTPIGSKLSSINENSSPSRSTRRTRRNSVTNTTATPLKTPSKAVQGKAGSAARLNLSTEESSPLRRCTRRLSTNIPIIKEEKEAVKTVEEQFISKRVTRSTSKSPQEPKATNGSENDFNSLQSSAKKATRTNKNNSKSKSSECFPNVDDDDHSDIEIINLDDDANEADEKLTQTSPADSMVIVLNGSSPANSKNVEIGTIKVEETTSNNLNISQKEPTCDEDYQPIAEEDKKSNCDGQETSESLNNGLTTEQNTKLNKLTEIIESNGDKNNMTYKNSTSDSFKETKKGDILEKAVPTPERRAQGLVIEVLELSTLNPLKLANLINSVNSSPDGGSAIHKSVSFKDMEETSGKNSYPKTPRSTKCMSYIKDHFPNKEIDASALAQALIEKVKSNDMGDEENILKSSTASLKGEAFNAANTPTKPSLNKMQSSTPISSHASGTTAVETPAGGGVSHTIPKNTRKQAESGSLSMSPEILLNNNTPACNNEADEANRKLQSPESPTVDTNLEMDKEFITSELIEEDDGRPSSKTPPLSDDDKISSEKQKISFAPSWAQSVAVSAEAGSKIDNISAELERIPIISKSMSNAEDGTEETKPKPADQTPDTTDKSSEEDELNIYSDSDNQIEKLAENEAPYNKYSFAFGEAEDAGDDYKSGDSMSSDERREIIENEILVDGESIGCETESEEEDEMESEDDASFIVQDSEIEHYSQEDSDDDVESCSKINTKVNGSNSKAYKRILICESSNSSESGEILNMSSLYKKDTKASISYESIDKSFAKNEESSFERSPQTEDRHEKVEVESKENSAAEELRKIQAFTPTDKNKCSTDPREVEEEEAEVVIDTSKMPDKNDKQMPEITARTADLKGKLRNMESDIANDVRSIDDNIIGSFSKQFENISCFKSSQLSQDATNFRLSDSREEKNTEEQFNGDEIKKSNSSKKRMLKQLCQPELLNKTVQEFNINKQTKSSSPEFLSTDRHGAGRRGLSLEGFQTLRKSMSQYRHKQFPSNGRKISNSSVSSDGDDNEDSKNTANEINSFCKYNQRCPSSPDESSTNSACLAKNKIKNKNKSIAEEEEKMSNKNQRCNESFRNQKDYECTMNQSEDRGYKDRDVLKNYSEKRQSQNIQKTNTAPESPRVGEVSTISIYDTEEDSYLNTTISTNKTSRKQRKSLIKSTSGLSVSFGQVSDFKKSNAIQAIAHSSFTIGISVKKKIRDSTSQPLPTSQSGSDAKEENPNSSSSEGEENTNHLSRELPPRRHSFTVNPKAILQDLHPVKIKNAEESVIEVEEPTPASGTMYAKPEHEFVEKKSVKRKRLSNSYCGGGSLDTTELEINLHKKSKRESIAGGLDQISSKDQKAAIDGSRKPNIQKILSRCDEILEAANRAKLEAKLNYNKSKVKIQKRKKQKETVEEADESTPEILTEKEHKRRERAKIEIEKALKASEDIILSNTANKLRIITKNIVEEVQSNTYKTAAQKKSSIEKEAFTVIQPTICDKSTLHIQTLKSSAGEVTEVPIIKQKKKSHTKIQLPSGTVRVEPVTPTKQGLHNGFRESPVTPRSVGFKVRHILTAGQDIPPDVPTELYKKNKRRRKIEEPQNTLPKPQWTQSGVFIEEDLYPSIPIARTGTTQFLVSALGTHRRKSKKSSGAASDGGCAKGSLVKLGNSSAAYSFKNNALFRDNIPRDTSHEVILRKKRQYFRSHF